MTVISDHLAALILDVAKESGSGFSVFAEDIDELVAKKFGLRFSQATIDEALRLLESAGAVARMTSELAGDLLQISARGALQYYDADAAPSEHTSTTYDRRYARAQTDFPTLKAYNFGGASWVNRVVDRLRVREDDDEVVIAPEFEITPIPASDRIVTLNDNQIKSLDDAAEEVVSGLTNENAVAGDSALRLRFIAQLRAGQELFRAGSVRVYLAYDLLVRMLGTLIEKYKDQAIAEAAKKLLGLLIEHMFK